MRGLTSVVAGRIWGGTAKGVRLRWPGVELEAEVERRVNEWKVQLQAENVFLFGGIPAEREMEHRVKIRLEVWRGFCGGGR